MGTEVILRIAPLQKGGILKRYPTKSFTTYATCHFCPNSWLFLYPDFKVAHADLSGLARLWGYIICTTYRCLAPGYILYENLKRQAMYELANPSFLSNTAEIGKTGFFYAIYNLAPSFYDLIHHKKVLTSPLPVFRALIFLCSLNPSQWKNDTGR